MLLCALAIGAARVRRAPSDRHSETSRSVDLVIGALCFIPLWWRRRYPLAVALITGIPSAFSGAGGRRRR